MQVEESSAPVTFENVPGEHGVQTEADVAEVALEYLPAGHDSHVVEEPPLPLNVLSRLARKEM